MMATPVTAAYTIKSGAAYQGCEPFAEISNQSFPLKF